MLNNCMHKGLSILFLNSLLLFQNPDAWALMGHVKYMTNDVEASRDCYERTISFTSDAAEMHSIYLRLASIYLQEEKVSNNVQLITDGDNQICEIFCTVFLLTLYIFWLRLYNTYLLLSVFQCKEHLPYGLQEIAILCILAWSWYSLL